MKAVIKTGGKQYSVAKGDVFKVELVKAEAGSEFTITDVLSVGEGDSLKVGAPFVDGASVLCDVLDHDRAKKIIVFKKKRRKGYTKKQGHRQDYTSLKVKEIKG